MYKYTLYCEILGEIAYGRSSYNLVEIRQWRKELQDIANANGFKMKYKIHKEISQYHMKIKK